MGSRARPARLLRMAQQRLHAEEHHAAAPLGRAGRRPRARAGCGDGTRPVRARHGRAHAGRVLHRAAGAHVQEGQAVVARRGHLRLGEVPVRRHDRRLPVRDRRRRHVSRSWHALPATAIARRHRDRRPGERRARTPRRVPRHERAAGGRAGCALRQGLRRPGQPAVLVEPRWPRAVADGSHWPGAGHRAQAVGHRAVRPGEADRGNQQQRPRTGAGVAAPVRRDRQLRFPRRGQHVRLSPPQGQPGQRARSSLRRDARPGAHLAGSDR